MARLKRATPLARTLLELSCMPTARVQPDSGHGEHSLHRQHKPHVAAQEKAKVDPDGYPGNFGGRFHVYANAEKCQDEEKGAVGEPLKHPDAGAVGQDPAHFCVAHRAQLHREVGSKDTREHVQNDGEGCQEIPDVCNRLHAIRHLRDILGIHSDAEGCRQDESRNQNDLIQELKHAAVRALVRWQAQQRRQLGAHSPCIELGIAHGSQLAAQLFRVLARHHGAVEHPSPVSRVELLLRLHLLPLPAPHLGHGGGAGSLALSLSQGLGMMGHLR